MTSETRPPVFTPKLVLGLAVIACGLILLLDNLRWYDGWLLLPWWPILPAAFGLARLRQRGPLHFGGHVWLALAVAGFVSQFGPWGLLPHLWPVFLVWAGLVVTLRALFPGAVPARRSCKVQASPRPTDSCDPEPPAPQVQP
jgi:hypothetical protein